MSEVIFVHGIANEQLSADWLEASWKLQLAGGLRAAGFRDLGDRVARDRSLPGAIDCRMAFYGNLFLKPGGQGAGETLHEPKHLQLADELAAEWLENVASRVTGSRLPARSRLTARPTRQSTVWRGKVTVFSGRIE
jgi:hypothetical protein